MTEQARVRIESHRLMRSAPPTDTVGDGIEVLGHHSGMFVRHTLVHIGAFLASLVTAAGIFLIGMLLLVKSSEDVTPLVGIGIASAATFVASFTMVRMVVLHRLFDEYPDKEDDPGLHHHLAKSITYGLVALALAILIAGGVLYTASAYTIM